MEEGSAALPKLTPGQQATLRMEFQEKQPTRVRVDVLRPTGFSALTGVVEKRLIAIYPNGYMA